MKTTNKLYIALLTLIAGVVLLQQPAPTNQRDIGEPRMVDCEPVDGLSKQWIVYRRNGKEFEPKDRDNRVGHATTLRTKPFCDCEPWARPLGARSARYIFI